MKTYGKVEFITKDRTWVIQCEPHVALKLKRVFAQLGKKSQGSHCFSDTPEFARDLLWFCERYPLDIKPLERSYMESQARRHKDRVTLVDQLVNGLIKPRAFEMAIQARDYQKVAAETVLSTGGLLLADQLGTGKTISAIAMLTDPRTRPALVVTLTHLPKQWANELQRFAPSLSTHIVKSANNWRARCREYNERQKAIKAKPKPAHGDTLKFAQPLKFTNGDKGDTFEIRFKGRKVTFHRNYGNYRITKWREREYEILPKAA